jgi:hypothetical protein
MILQIAPDRSIGDVQMDFAEAFPGLKLAFFSKPHAAYKGSFAKFLIQKAQTPLCEIAPNIQAGILHLEPDLPTWQVERLFEEEFALHVQVFRKSGRTWLETSVSDDLTLEQQQAKAVASEHVRQEFVDPMDYREQD